MSKKTSLQAQADLTQAMPYFRAAIEDATKDGKRAGLAIVAISADGKTEKVLATIGEANELFDDIATILEIGPDTEEQKLDVSAHRFCEQLKAAGVKFGGGES